VSLAPYAELLRRPGVLRLVLVALVARIPHAATGVVVTLHVVGALGKGYAQAGLVAAAMTVGMAIGAPWRGRRVDSRGVRRALLPSVIIEAAVWVVAPFLGYEELLGAAFVAGVFLVPVFSVVRQSLGVLVPLGEQRTAYALDSVGTELTFMLAPAIGVLIATQVSTTAALVTVGIATVGSGALLMWFDPPTRSHQVAGAGESGSTGFAPAAAPAGVASADLVGARVLTPALLAVLATAVAASLVLNGTDVSIVASLKIWGQASSLGWMMALWSAGSVLGGLAYGAGRRTVHPLALALTLAVLTVPAALVHSPLLLGAAVFVAGLPCAPALSSITATLARLVPEERRGEAMGWQGTAMTIGGSLGAPLCGWMIDAGGPGAGFLTAAVVGGLLAAGGLVALRVSRARSVGVASLETAAVS
jgi:MFS family permease